MKPKYFTILSISFLVLLLISLTTAHINAAESLPSDVEIRIDNIENIKFDFSAPNKNDQKLLLIRDSASHRTISKNELDALNQERAANSQPALTPVATLHPETSELDLKNYNGGPIKISGSSPANLTIKVSESNTIATFEFRPFHFGILNETEGGSITIIGNNNQSILRLPIWKDDNEATNPSIYGISASLVTLGNLANVEITLTNALSSPDAQAIGIFADAIELSADSKLKIKTLKNSTTLKKTTRATGIHAKSNLTINNDTLHILVHNTSEDSIALYKESTITPIQLSKPENTILSWKNLSGNQSQPANTAIEISQDFEEVHGIVDQNATEKQLTFAPRQYNATVINGTITTTTQGDVSSAKFVQGATVSIKAKALASQLPFKTWEANIPINFSNPTQNNTTFTMPSNNVELTANYNAFQTEPTFAENPGGTGTITLALNGNYTNDSTPIEGYIVPYKGDLNDVDKRLTLSTLTSKTSNQTFSVSPQTLQSGRYEVYVKIDDIWHISRTFTVNWQDYIAIEINFPSDIIYNTEIAPVITPLNPPLEESKLSFTWYRDSLDTAPIAQTKKYKTTLEDIGHHLILKVTHSDKQGFISEKSSVVEKRPNNSIPALDNDAFLITANSIALKPEHSQYEIKDSTKNTAWGNQVSSLSPNTMYQIAIRFKEVATHKASQSQVLYIKTIKGSTLAPLLPYVPSEETKTETPETPATPNTSVSIFTDIQQDAWYSQAIAFVHKQGLMNGISETKFAPNAATTRGQLLTILHRFAGSPKATATQHFLDVSDSDYYQSAITWAAQSGIVSGYGDGTFGAKNTITREQLAVLLYRFAKTKAFETQISISLSQFGDNTAVSDYAKTAMTWAVENGFIQGTDKQMLAPKANASRAEIATIFMRYHQKFVK